MECDYAEGECSICGKRVKSKAEYCVHLKNYKGGSYQGKPCFEILHGVTFTGMGLLDKKGADESALIKQVANLQEDKSMADKDKDTTGQDEFVDDDKSKEPGGGDTESELKKLRDENKRLKTQLEEAQKRIQEMEASQAAAESQAKAEQLLKKWEAKGRTFESEKDRATELERLAGLSEEALAATENVIESLTGTASDPSDKTKSEAASKSRMKTDAGVDPLVVDDKKPANLEDKLKSGFMAAYKAHINQEVA